MRANEVVVEPSKKPYVKPELLTHGSVQQLTEGGHHTPTPTNDGSNFRIPSKGGWETW
ncbi:MAG TPA: hypothetical protein VFE47_10010 [Tepidisphaeraceae bacterium]|jgi:hypothetical protein|nr:hypothetical protein [Tepidisphaeraceae bacterium]